MKFTKMHGIGNDFVVVDRRALDMTDNDQDLARSMCDRRFGIGADGLIFVENGDLASIRMRMLNPDGSESEMCGNGLRCVAKFVGPAAQQIETGDRKVEVQLLHNGFVRVDMGQVRVVSLERKAAGRTGVVVDIGNPHFVVFTDDLAAVPLEEIGPILEHDPAFPDRTNVHFVQVLDSQTLLQRTWERGAGITLACGSGACASAVAAVAHGLTGAITEVRLPGGSLEIEVRESRVWMTGPAEVVFEGDYRL